MIREIQQRAEQKISGFQSPAADYLEGRLNISEILVVDPHCTFYFQMDSQAMLSQGVAKSDILIIDRSITPVNGALVIACIGDSFYCRRYHNDRKHPYLSGDNNEMIKTTDGESLQVWGVVTALCRNVLPESLKKGKYRRVCTL